VELDCNINDPVFAETCARRLLDDLAKTPVRGLAG
jgi:hypothetical protein